MSTGDALAAVARFRASCERDPLVLAAFLGGSYAAGTATDASDIDVYLVTDEDDYQTFFARRRDFVLTWAAPVRLTDVLDFEGLGFDMLDFQLEDGVRGQLAMGHTGNFMALHGGPHQVLVDKAGVLAGITFPCDPSPPRPAPLSQCRRLASAEVSRARVRGLVGGRGSPLAAGFRRGTPSHHPLSILSRQHARV